KMAASTDKVEFGTGAAAAAAPKQEPSWEYHLRKYLMLLATLVATATYAAGLSPPGGVWQESGRDGEGRSHEAGDPVLYHSARYLAFFYFNATAFAASLVVNLLLLVLNERRTAWLAVLRFVMVLDLLGLMGAFATGSCEDLPTTVYVSTLVVALAAYVGIHILLATYAPSEAGQTSPSQVVVREKERPDDNQTESQSSSPARELLATSGGGWQGSLADEVNTGNKNEGIEKAKSLILLLATLAATITYQAGMDPPGGVWQEADEQGRYKAGDPILLFKHAARYKAFFYCNSTAFVASLVVILMVQNKSLMSGHVLEVAMILDLFGLIGAYAAGSCREVSTSIYVVALAGAVLVYVVIHVVFFTLDNEDLSNEEKRRIDKRR
uniref:PGG domain-containing protein n=1 Tax=Aegilops tauschii subsp. strangulata TaxID=200361 RepID=A0A453RD70_AEGTS